MHAAWQSMPTKQSSHQHKADNKKAKVCQLLEAMNEKQAG
jgi:hypothetical protein